MIEVVKWIEKKVGSEVIAVWLDINGREVDPKLAFYKGHVSVHNNALLTKLELPKEVGGYVSVNNNALLTKLEMPKEVGEYVSVYSNALLAKLEMPKEVGGGVYVYNNALLAKLELPKEAGGDVIVHSNALLTKLEMSKEVGGYVYVHNNALLAKLEIPKEVGESVYVYNNAPLTKFKDIERPLNNKEATLDLISAKLRMKGILFADGIMSHIISEKNNVFKIRIYGKKELSYCVYRNGNFSHGKTVKEAIESLRYKASIKDVSEFKTWKLDDVKSLNEVISAYRSITGACEDGVRNFCQGIEIKNKYKLSEIVEITCGKYGHDEFKNFEWSKK